MTRYYTVLSMDERLSDFLAQLQPLCLAAIPSALRRGRCHVVWRPELWRDNKIGKVPYSPRGFRASGANPRSWDTFAEAVQAYERGGYAGIGYMLATHQPHHSPPGAWAL